MVKLADLVAKIEKQYREEKKIEAQKIHDDLAAVIQGYNTDTQTILFVLEMIRYELIDSKAGLAARALDGSDEEVVDSADVQLETLVALLTDALTS